jgi:radical SAM protein with 4Fe4S-binding SPASM domain
MPDYEPLLSLVELTLRCNLRCLHCGSTSGRSRRDELDAGELVGVMRDLARLGAQDVVLLGGEPLLHRSFGDLASLCTDLGMTPLLITNGLLLDEAALDTCRRAGVGRIGISVDAALPAVHDRIRGLDGAHRKAVEAIRRSRDHGFTTTVITTVSRLNLHELPAMRDWLLGRGLGWQIQVASPNGARFDSSHLVTRGEFYALARFISRCRATYTLEELPVAGAHDVGYHSECLVDYATMPHWPGCMGGINTVGVQSDGLIKPCLSMAERFAEGSVRTDGLVDVWRDPGRFTRNRLFSPESLEGGCRGCEHGPTCRAGCPDLAYNVTGSLFDNPYCLYRIESEQVDRGPGIWTIEDDTYPSDTGSDA